MFRFPILVVLGRQRGQFLQASRIGPPSLQRPASKGFGGDALHLQRLGNHLFIICSIIVRMTEKHQVEDSSTLPMILEIPEALILHVAFH